MRDGGRGTEMRAVPWIVESYQAIRDSGLGRPAPLSSPFPTGALAQEKPPAYRGALIAEMGSKFGKQKEQAAWNWGSAGRRRRRRWVRFARPCPIYRPLSRAARLASRRSTFGRSPGFPSSSRSGVRMTRGGRGAQAYGTETPGAWPRVLRGRASARLPRQAGPRQDPRTMGEALLPVLLEWTGKPEADDVLCATEWRFPWERREAPRYSRSSNHPEPSLREFRHPALAVTSPRQVPGHHPVVPQHSPGGKGARDKVAERNRNSWRRESPRFPPCRGAPRLESTLARVRAARVSDERLGPSALAAAPASVPPGPVHGGR